MQSKWTARWRRNFWEAPRNYGEGRFCFPEPVSRYLRGAIEDGRRDRQPIIWVGAFLPCGQRVPSVKLCSTNTVSFSTGVSRTTYKKPLGTRLRCKRAQSSTRIRRGDREVGFVAHKYRELTVPLVAGGTAVRSAWPGRMGPVEYYTRRSHARCREIAAADGVGSVRLLRVIRMRCRSAVPNPPETPRNPGDLDSPLFLWKSVN